MNDRSRLEWLGWTAVAVGAVIAVVFGIQLAGDQNTVVATPLIGRQVADLELPLMESDGTVSLSDRRGSILVVTFWASWCLPCRDEQPELVAAANRYAGEGVHFVAVLYQDDLDDASRFLDEFGRAESASYVTDPGSRAAIEFGLFGIPETFFVDPEGVVVGKVSGGVDLPIILSTIEAIRAGAVPGEASTGETFQAP